MFLFQKHLNIKNKYIYLFSLKKINNDFNYFIFIITINYIRILIYIDYICNIQLHIYSY